MRLIRKFAVSAGIVAIVTGSAAAGLAASAGPARAAGLAPANQSGQAMAFADPSVATPGTGITFQITCGSLVANPTATFFGQALGLPEQVPMSQTDRQSGQDMFTVTVTLPGNIRPGTYHPDMDCSDGSSATARLTVTSLPGSGGAQTGDGTTSTATDSGLASLGLGLIAAGAVAAGFAVRRRTSGRPHQQ